MALCVVARVSYSIRILRHLGPFGSAFLMCCRTYCTDNLLVFRASTYVRAIRDMCACTAVMEDCS